MNRKLCALIGLTALTVLLVSTACTAATPAPPAGSEAPAEGAVVELVYQNWTARDEEMPWERELIAKFEESYPNIKIKLSVGPYAQHHDKIVAATKAGAPPDVYEVIPEDMIAFATQGVAMNLDDYVAKEGGETFSGQYFPSAWAMGHQWGHTYGLPWRYGVSSMFINVKMFEDAGVPIPDGETWTWADMLEIAKKLTAPDKGQYGFAYSGTKDSFGTSWEWMGHLFANEGGLIADDGTVLINNDAAVESLTWWTELLTVHGVVPPETATLDEAAIVDMLGRGQVAMWNNGPWYINNFRNSYPDTKIATVPMPKGKQDGASAGGTLLAISPLTKHPDEAWEFIKFMTSQEILKEWSTRGYFMPTRTDVLQEPIFQEPPMLAFSQSALRPNSRILGQYPEVPTLFQGLHGHMQEAFLGLKTPKEALDATAQEWSTILQPYYAEGAPPPAPKAEAEPVTIRALIRPDEGENVATYAAKFEQETGIKVQVDFVGWAEIHDKTVTTLAVGGGGYDIIFIPSANAIEFMSTGMFEPIDDLIPADKRGEWLEAVLGLYTYQDQLLAMPWYSGGAHMVYNGDMLAAAGVDPATIETWDAMLDACAKIKAAGAADFCFSPSAKYPGNFYYNWGTMVQSLGGDFFDTEGNPIFQNGDAALQAFQLIKTGVDEGYFDPAGIALDDYETLIEFGAGTTAFLLDSTWSATQATRNPDLSGVTEAADIMLVPGGNGVRSGSYLYAGGLGLMKNSEHKEEAKQFLAYLTSEEAQKHHAIQGANMPTRVALFGDADIAASWKGFAVLAEQLNYGRFPPQFTWFEEWRRSAATAVQDVMAGRRTPQEAVDWLVEETNRLKSQ